MASLISTFSIERNLQASQTKEWQVHMAKEKNFTKHFPSHSFVCCKPLQHDASITKIIH
jgi:hypothetical protein